MNSVGFPCIPIAAISDDTSIGPADNMPEVSKLFPSLRDALRNVFPDEIQVVLVLTVL